MSAQARRESNANRTCPAQIQSTTHLGAGRVAVSPLNSGLPVARGMPLAESLRREKELLRFFAAPLVAFLVEQSARIRAMASQSAIAGGNREPMQDYSDGQCVARKY